MRRREVLAIGAASALAGSWSRSLLAATPDPVAVIVARSHKASTLSLGALRQIFLQQGGEHEGLPFSPFNQARNTFPRVRFDRRVLGMSPEESARYWVDQRIRGEASPPRSIANVRLLLRVVERFPGAIAYIRPSDLNANVKVLRISGLLPTDPKYPLR